MNSHTLRMENLAFRGTRGISEHCLSDFRPAFLDTRSGRIEIARLSSGNAAPAHIISWLPKDWATSIDDDGLVTHLNPRVIAGFERDGIFYTREEAADMD